MNGRRYLTAPPSIRFGTKEGLDDIHDCIFHFTQNTPAKSFYNRVQRVHKVPSDCQRTPGRCGRGAALRLHSQTGDMRGGFGALHSKAQMDEKTHVLFWKTWAFSVGWGMVHLGNHILWPPIPFALRAYLP